MVEAVTQTETSADKQPEILDVDSYGGLYGRLILASQSQESEIANLINPGVKTDIDTSKLTISDSRDYNLITRGLSKNERLKAWEGIEFNDAYKMWRSKFTKIIQSTTDEKKLEAINAVSGKLASEFNEEDADNLYDAFSRGKSDTTAFAKLLVSKLKTDGKTDFVKIQELSSDIEWVAGGLFGKQTAVAVSRIIEIEAEIARNKPRDIVKKIFSDKNRINNLKDEETEILNKLYGGIDAVKTRSETFPKSQDVFVKQKTAEREKTSAKKRTRIRVRPATGIDLIRNNIEGKIYTVIDTTPKDKTKKAQVMITDSLGDTKTYPRKWLEDQINKEGTPWEVFEPANINILNNNIGDSTKPEVEEEGDESDFIPAPKDRDEVPVETP